MSKSIFSNEKGSVQKVIAEKIKEMQDDYLADKRPWVIGYSGGKDSTVITQLAWMAIEQLPKEKRHKKIYIVTTDTMVENPVVATWVENSINKINLASEARDLPISAHLIKPIIKDRFWVQLLGRGYPAPRRGMRWCTDRLKIKPSTNFIKSRVSKHGDVLLLLGVRSSESAARSASIKKHSLTSSGKFKPHRDLKNCYVSSPIEDWSQDDVWQFLHKYPNPWEHSNQELQALYAAGSEDNECPVVVDTSSPSCGSSRFGCWVCTLVTQDKSMTAMIQNDQDKEWMMPLLKIRNELDFKSDSDRLRDKESREFVRMNGKVAFYKNKDEQIDVVHGPYTHKKRIDLLKKILSAEVQIQTQFDQENKGQRITLIDHEELEEVRRIWIEDKKEIEDVLPGIYKKIKGKEYEGKSYHTSSVLDDKNLDLLETLCGDNRREYELVRNMLVQEMKLKSKGIRRGFINELESELNRFIYVEKDEVMKAASERQDLIETIEIKPINDYEGIQI